MNGKNWCFTLNNPESDDGAKLLSLFPLHVKYIIFGHEEGESGTPHLQGYLQCNTNKRLSGIKKLQALAHWELAKGDAQANITYCSKEGAVETLGIPTVRKGQRNDLQDFIDAVNGGMHKLSELRVAHAGVCARYPRYVREYIGDVSSTAPIESHPLRDWQVALNDELKRPANDRTITFVIDPKGNAGKTWFAKYFTSLHENSQYMEMGKKADMAYALDPTITTLFINCGRKQTEFMNYGFLESVKDGMVFSTKYESGLKKMNKCHVVVMMNQQPEMDALSADRYNIILLN